MDTQPQTNPNSEYPLREEFLEAISIVRTAKSKKKSQSLLAKATKPYRTRMDKVGPVPWDNEFIKATVKHFETLPQKEQKREAQMFFCWIHDFLAWLQDAPRVKYTMFSIEGDMKIRVGNPHARLIELAYPPASDGKLPTRDVVRGWYEEFDIPDIDQVKFSSEWLTENEVLAIARAMPDSGLPTTRRGLHKKAKKEDWEGQGRMRKKAPD